jgi:hypothetical protein
MTRKGRIRDKHPGSATLAAIIANFSNQSTVVGYFKFDEYRYISLKKPRLKNQEKH